MKARKNGYLRSLVISMIIMGMLVLGSAAFVSADEPPYADADPDHQIIDVGETAYFSGSGSIDRDGTIVAYYWIFGDGLIYSGEKMNYTYNAPGDYTVELIVEDDGGNTDSDFVKVTVEDGSPPSGNVTVWIDSMETEKPDYEENETVLVEVDVERGDDLLTYVWEGTVVLEVFDESSVLVHTDDADVYLPAGGDEQTLAFSFVVTEAGTYVISASLFDINDDLVDTMEIRLQVREGSGGGNDPPEEERFVWIESLTTDLLIFEPNGMINCEVVVERGDDLLDYVWEGILTLEVFNETGVLVYTEDQNVSLPCGGWTQTLYFEFDISEPGGYIVRATLVDQHGELMDIKEIRLIVDDGSGGGNDDGDRDDPDDGDRNDTHDEDLVEIESLVSDKENYMVNEVIRTTVILKRGDDWLTYVWEGTLTLKVYNEAREVVFEESRDVSLAAGGMTQTHEFEFSLSEPGEYFIVAELYDSQNDLVDLEDISIHVLDDADGGGNGLPQNNNEGFFTGNKGGLFLSQGGWQIALGAVLAVALLVISSFVLGRYMRKSENKKKHS